MCLPFLNLFGNYLTSFIVFLGYYKPHSFPSALPCGKLVSLKQDQLDKATVHWAGSETALQCGGATAKLNMDSPV